ncbi:hypothetical protein OAF30_04775, partial [Flavobacteriales bacterium]|nr:hypothetical protein [Flavobacteriales bacterium]
MRNFILACFTCILAPCVHGQITALVAEPFADHNGSEIPELEGMITYRIYAEMTHADDELSAIFGDMGSP